MSRSKTLSGKSIRRYYADHEKNKALGRKYYWRKRKQILAKEREKRKLNRTEVRVAERKRKLRRKFGMSLEKLTELLSKQDGRCAICNEVETCTQNGMPRQMALDHDHETGQPRGFLCHLCNTALGKFRDNPLFLRNAADYVEMYKL